MLLWKNVLFCLIRYPWGQEAFDKAKLENKLIFLSVGYSTCHWCHVMERESFENEEIGRILNENFVSIKVDREERPDVDRVYMTFIQVILRWLNTNIFFDGSIKYSFLIWYHNQQTDAHSLLFAKLGFSIFKERPSSFSLDYFIIAWYHSGQK